MVTTKMNWSGPNVIHFGRKSHLDLPNSFWSRPNHYGQVQINLVRPKQFWTDQNCFGHIEGQGISFLYYLGKSEENVDLSHLFSCTDGYIN